MTMTYFAYGSNINLAHLRWYLALHGIDHHDHVGEIRRAILHDHRLRTNYLTWDGLTGACNIKPAEGHAVEGLVMTITERVQYALRVKEGHPRCYEETPIKLMVGSKPITAFTYIVVPDRQLPCDVPVSHEYRQLILDGARKARFSPQYRRHLHGILRPIRFATPSHIRRLTTCRNSMFE